MRAATLRIAASACLAWSRVAAEGQEPVPILTLEEVVARAQRQGLTAQSAEAARDAARWAHRAFRTSLFPRFSLSGIAPDLNREITPVVQPNGTTIFVPRSLMQSSASVLVRQPVPLAGGELFLSSGLSRIDLLGDETTRYWRSTPLLIGWQQDLFRPRSLVWETREQDLRYEIAEREYLESRELVAERAAAAYFDFHAAAVGVANALTNAAVNDTLYVLSKGRFEVGKIAENDLLQGELALLRARAAVVAAKLEQERAAAALRLELNLPDDAPLAVAPPPIPVELDPDPETSVAEALRSQSRLRALDLAAVQSRRRVVEARLENGFNARVTAGLGYNQTGRLIDDAYRSPLSQQQFALAFDIPLVQWGRGRAAIAAARAEQARQESVAIESRRTIAIEARFAARQIAQARRQFSLAAKADTVAARRFDVAKNRYVIGRIGVGDLFIAQAEKDAALLASVQATRGYWLAYYRLRRMTLYDFVHGQRLETARP